VLRPTLARAAGTGYGPRSRWRRSFGSIARVVTAAGGGGWWSGRHGAARDDGDGEPAAGRRRAWIRQDITEDDIQREMHRLSK